MVDPIPDPPDLAPEDLSAVEFGRSRRGYEPVEVTALLGRAADAIRAWQERDRRLQDRVVSLAAELDAAQVIDEARITSALGEETARIIAAARDAASEIRSRAEQEAARLVEEADAAADETRSAAIEETSSARAEAERERTDATLAASALRQDAERYADELRATAQAEQAELAAAAESVLAERTAEAEAVATGIRETAEVERDALIAEGERARDDARGLAAAEIDRAKDDARSMLAETKEVRTEMLRDLAERHREAHRQIDVARAERDRIVDAIRTLGASLDGTVGELIGETDSSGFAGGFDAGSRSNLSIDEFVVEIEANLRPVSEIASSSTTAGAGSAGPVSADVGADGGADVDSESGDAADDTDVEIEGSVDADVADDAAVAESIDELPEDATREEVVLDARLLESGRFGDGAASDDADDAPADADPVGGPTLAAVATVHDLFERVRSEPGDERNAENDDDNNAANDAENDAEADEPEPSLLDRRDAVLEPIEQSLARTLKRTVSDEQNELLDGIRRIRRGAPSLDELMPAGADVERYLAQLRDDLGAAAAAGREFWAVESGDELTGGSASTAAEAEPSERTERVVTDLLDHRRAHLERVLNEAAADGVDAQELLGRVRGAYREWRSSRLGEAAGDLATSGFVDGMAQVAPTGTSWCWVVDHGGLPCSDAEDNALAGAVQVGEAFPTGDAYPPAHSGCRCILTPSPR